MIVAPTFRTIPMLQRTVGLHDEFYASGNDGPLDLICLTPEEFEDARHRPTIVAAVLPEAIDLLARPLDEATD